MSNKIDNSFAARNIDFTEDNSLANFDWKRNDLVNKFVLDSPDGSSDNFDSEDESGDEDDNDRPPTLVRYANDPKCDDSSDDESESSDDESEEEMLKTPIFMSSVRTNNAKRPCKNNDKRRVRVR